MTTKIDENFAVTFKTAQRKFDLIFFSSEFQLNSTFRIQDEPQFEIFPSGSMHSFTPQRHQHLTSFSELTQLVASPPPLSPLLQLFFSKLRKINLNVSSVAEKEINKTPLQTVHYNRKLMFH